MPLHTTVHSQYIIKEFAFLKIAYNKHPIDCLCGCGCHIDGLEQNCSNSIDNALELLQSCIKPSNYASIFSEFKSLIYVLPCYCSVVCNIILYWTMLWWKPSAYCFNYVVYVGYIWWCSIRSNIEMHSYRPIAGILKTAGNYNSNNCLSLCQLWNYIQEESIMWWDLLVFKYIWYPFDKNDNLHGKATFNLW